jgi:hypothetical protein
MGMCSAVSGTVCEPNTVASLPAVEVANEAATEFLIRCSTWFYSQNNAISASGKHQESKGSEIRPKTSLTSGSPYARLNRLGKPRLPFLSQTRFTGFLATLRAILRGVFRRAGVVKQAACDPYAKGVRLGRSETSSLGLFRPGIKRLDRSGERPAQT